jgi:hypothetical protein
MKYRNFEARLHWIELKLQLLGSVIKMIELIFATLTF